MTANTRGVIGFCASVAIVLAIAVALDLRGAPYPDPPLLQAAGRGDLLEVTRLLDSGVSIETKNESGETAIYSASRSQDKKMLEFLISRGADITALRARGESVLHNPVRAGLTEWVTYLISKGAGKRYMDMDSPPTPSTPLHDAAGMGNDQMVKLLVNAGFRTGLRDTNGLTPLDWARRSARDSTVQLLEEFAAKGR